MFIPHLPLSFYDQSDFIILKNYLIFFKKPDESFKNNWIYSYLKRDFHYMGILTLLCSFIENSKTSLYGILNVGKSFFYHLTLGVAARKSRAADNKSAIFGIFFDGDLQIQ